MNKISIGLVFLFVITSLHGQAVYEDERYVPETDSLVLDKLDKWQGLKFGLLMHWGPYTQWGIVASWSICPEDYNWCQRKDGTNPSNYYEYLKEYEGLKKTFNPVKYNPEKWAKAAKNAGMKYVVFTTKHHDGFCMYDSKYTDYKITDKDCPFSTHPKANITKELFEAFREENIWIGAYFSKPDWNHKNYWDPYFPPKDRNVNYDPVQYPEKWKKYVDFTHNQILELLTDYGKIDIMWLDGGWVAKTPEHDINTYYENMLKSSKGGFFKSSIVNQDINMDELVVKARQKQPGLIVVDRAVHGKNQNYLTPENRVPEKTLPYPWESCIISGGPEWSYYPGAEYMSGREGIHMLIDVVAKGGNLLLNVGPTPEGEWQEGAYRLLQDYGDWIAINSESIYNTIPIAPYKEANICFTQNKAGQVYAAYMAAEHEQKIPSEIVVESLTPTKNTSITLLGSSKKLKWKALKNGFKVYIPKSLQNNPPCKSAWVLKIDAVKRN